MLCAVCVDQVWHPRRTNEITVVTGGADLGLVQEHVRPEEVVSDLEERGGGGEPLQHVPQTHAERCEDGGRLGLCWVWLSEELSWHLSVCLHHCSHGSLLGVVSHRINVHTSIVSLRGGEGRGREGRGGEGRGGEGRGGKWRGGVGRGEEGRGGEE